MEVRVVAMTRLVRDPHVVVVETLYVIEDSEAQAAAIRLFRLANFSLKLSSIHQ